MSSIQYVALDVSSTDAWVAVEGCKPKRFPLSADGAKALANWVAGLCPGKELIAVMEHTGVYSIAWANLLREQGIDSAQINPARIRSFASASGFRSKTDRCDCRAILAYALHAEPSAQPPMDPAQACLAMLLTQLSAIKQQLSALASRRHALSFLPDSVLVDDELDDLEADLIGIRRRLERKIEQLVESDARLRWACGLLRTIPSLGPVTAWQLCTRLDALLERSGAELTALCGLAPAQRQSGKRAAPGRIDRQGSAVLRRALYMAALSGVRCCPPLIELKARLREEGKPPKVILIAAARKLLLIARAVLHQDSPFTFPA
jgi:transposase